MKNFMRKFLFAVATPALAGGLATCSTEQPKILCLTAHGGFGVRYTLVEGTGPCAMLKGGVFGVQSYVEGGPGKSPVFTKPPVAVKPAEIGELIDAYAATVDSSKQASIGTFADEKPGADGFCTVGTMSPVALTLAAVPAMPTPDGMGMTDPLPAVDVRYDLSNVRFYVSPSVLGTVMSADLTYVKDGCTATYKLNGLYPAVGCERIDTVTGPDGMAMDKRSGEPQAEACSTCADSANGRPTGSGIGPDIDNVCDPESLLCVPAKDAPSIRDTPLVCSE
jgi:hypothetical protein